MLVAQAARTAAADKELEAMLEQQTEETLQAEEALAAEQRRLLDKLTWKKKPGGSTG